MSADAEILEEAVLARWDKLGKDLVARLLDAFLAGAEGHLRSCRPGMGGEDLPRVEAGAHTLKSSAGNLGARRLQALCEQLEAAAGKGLVGDVARLGPELEEAFAKTLAAIRRKKAEREGRLA